MPHIHEKIDFTVEVFIVHKNKVLLRMHDKVKRWLGPGGHIELDEDPIEAAHREVKEEVGLDIELVGGKQLTRGEPGDLLPPVAMYRHPMRGNDVTISPHEHIDLIYFATSKTDKIAVLNENDRSDECRWCTKEDLLTMDIFPNTKAYALAALNRLGEK